MNPGTLPTVPDSSSDRASVSDANLPPLSAPGSASTVSAPARRRRLLRVLLGVGIVAVLAGAAVGTGVMTAHGRVKGHLAHDGAALSGVGVILCAKSSDHCTTDKNLQATTDASGSFEIDNLPFGDYVVMFDPSGPIKSSQQDLRVGVTDQTASCLLHGLSGCHLDSIPFATDGDSLVESRVVSSGSVRGTFCSNKYGLCLDAGPDLDVAHVHLWGLMSDNELEMDVSASGTASSHATSSPTAPTSPSPSPTPRPWTALSHAAAGTFNPTGSMTTDRQRGTATLLKSGRVLLVGGAYLKPSAELFDPTTGAFSTAGSTKSIGGQTATLLEDGRVLIAGGGGLQGGILAGELYDPDTGAFTSTGSMAIARDGPTATLISGGRVLIVAGYGSVGSDNGYLASAELYDAGTGKFSPTGSMSTARSEYTATLLKDGHVLIAGGTDGHGTGLASAELYDPKTGKFSLTGPMLAPRAHHTATRLSDGRVLLVGGYGDCGGGTCGEGLFTAEVYNPKTGKFSATDPATVAYFGHTATLLDDGRVLVVGGDSRSDTRDHAELYDPNTGKFSDTGFPTTARYDHSATLLDDGCVLIAGGTNKDHDDFASAEVYQP